MSEARRLIKELGNKEIANRDLKHSETNDCVVRAIQHAFVVEYIDAHHFCEVKLHRVKRNGVYTRRYLTLINQAFGQKIKSIKATRPKKTKVEVYSEAKEKSVTKRIVKQVPYDVKGFVKTFNEGNYIVIVKKHAFAVVNGKIFGNYEDDKKVSKSIHMIFKVN
jgi:hypothetical protein